MAVTQRSPATHAQPPLEAPARLQAAGGTTGPLLPRAKAPAATITRGPRAPPAAAIARTVTATAATLTRHSRTAAATATERRQKTAPDRLIRPTGRNVTKVANGKARIDLSTPGSSPLRLRLARGRSTVLRQRRTDSMITTFLEKGQRQRDVHVAVLPTLQNDVRASLIEDIRLAE